MPFVLLLLILLGIPQGSVYASSLQEMIDQAPPNATIQLQAEVYTGPIEIKKPLTLVGRGIERTVIKGEGTGNVVTVTADDVVITDLTITGSGEENQDSAVRINGNGAKIQQIEINNAHYGIYSTGSRQQITNNRITGEASKPVSKRGNGIQLDHSSDNLIQGNQIEHVQDGIYFDQSFDNVIDENLITGSRYGFHMMYAGRSKLQKNEVSQSVTGAMVMETSQVVFEKNRFLKQRDTKGFGMLLFQCKECNVIDNIISDNTHGIGFDSISASKIAENTISSNSVGIDIFGPIESSTISRNSFIGNVQQAVVDGAVSSHAFQEQGVGNYWDDYVGFDVTGDRIGETGYSSQGLLFHWIKKAPAVQIMFASPAQSFLETVAQSGEKPIDAYPMIKPATKKQQDLRELESSHTLLVFIFLCLFLVTGSISFIFRSASYSRP